MVETKRQPPLWTVKHGNCYKAQSIGVDTRAKLEAFATEASDGFVVVVKAIVAHEARRLDSIALGWVGAPVKSCIIAIPKGCILKLTITDGRCPGSL